MPENIIDTIATLMQLHHSASALNALADRVRGGALGVHPDAVQVLPGSSRTLFRWAVGYGASDLAHALLDMGADPNLDSVLGSGPDSEGAPTRSAASPRDRALADACLNCPDIVGRLLAMGAAPNHKGDWRPPLHNAVYSGRADVVRMLLEAGADPLALDDIGATAITIVDDSFMDPACVQLVREAAWPHLASRKGSSIRVRRRKVVIEGLREWLELAIPRDGACLVLFRKGTAAELAHAMAERLGTEAVGGAHQRWVMETGRSYYGVVSLKGHVWSIGLLEVGKRFNPSRGLELAEALSTEGEIVLLDGAIVRVFRDAAEREPQVEFDDAEVGLEWFRQRGIVLPMMAFAADGFCVGLDLYGIKQSDIEDGWIVWDNASLA